MYGMRQHYGIWYTAPTTSWHARHLKTGRLLLTETLKLIIALVIMMTTSGSVGDDSFYTPAQRSWRGGILDSPCPAVCRLSVCRRHGFQSISQVCFRISISNFICMLMVVIGRRLLIFSDVTFKMAAWQPYWIFWFPDSKFTLALNINSKLQGHNTYVYG